MTTNAYAELRNLSLSNPGLLTEIQKETVSDFDGYFSQSSNNAYKQVSQDMTKKWSMYYVNSSHNTYLTGDQLAGKASVDAYKDVLLKGVRCVELDCWDGEDGQPIITHGHTLCTKITFRSVIETIKEYAFVTSPYPVILSMEVHCGHEQQDKMADMMVEVFGDLLLKERLPADPSPEALKGKIVIKGKAITGTGHHSETKEKKSLISMSSFKGALTNSVQQISLFGNKKHPGEDEAASKTEKEPVPLPTKDLAEDEDEHDGTVVKLGNKLHALAIYQVSKKLKSLQNADDFTLDHVASLSESKACHMITKSPAEFKAFCEKAFIRVYPKGGRVDSSNYNPVPFWNGGCQLVAINAQHFDRPNRMNQGFFLQNHNYGYVLKKPISNKVWNSEFSLLCAQDLDQNLERVRLYANIDLITPSTEKFFSAEDQFLNDDKERHVSKMLSCNNHQVSWNTISSNGRPDSIIHFSTKIEFPAFSFLQISLMKSVVGPDTLVGFSMIPIDQLARGYRKFSLYDEEGKLMKTFIFGFVEMT